MEFAFTEEQEMIRDTAAAFLAEVSRSEAIRPCMATEQGYDQALWQRICGEMYWQAIHIPEAYGGMGLGLRGGGGHDGADGALFAVLAVFLHGLPGQNALLLAGNEEQKSQWLGQLVRGALTAHWLLTAAAATGSATLLPRPGDVNGDSYVLNGELPLCGRWAYRRTVDRCGP